MAALDSIIVDVSRGCVSCFTACDVKLCSQCIEIASVRLFLYLRLWCKQMGLGGGGCQGLNPTAYFLIWTSVSFNATFHWLVLANKEIELQWLKVVQHTHAHQEHISTPPPPPPPPPQGRDLLMCPCARLTHTCIHAHTHVHTHTCNRSKSTSRELR